MFTSRHECNLSGLPCLICRGHPKVALLHAAPGGPGRGSAVMRGIISCVALHALCYPFLKAGLNFGFFSECFLYSSCVELHSERRGRIKTSNDCSLGLLPWRFFVVDLTFCTGEGSMYPWITESKLRRLGNGTIGPYEGFDVR
jgi:hypothetical protein